MPELLLKNANLVLANEVVKGAVLIRDGRIADIDTSTDPSGGEDMDGNYVVPGLVELHTDHLESHYAPRPKVRWNPLAAVLAHDAQITTSGITTVFDALRVGTDEDADLATDDMRRLADAVDDASRNDRLRAEHFLHLRCEVSSPDCLDSFAAFQDDARVRMVSLMDHAPGQRQFRHMEAYSTYYQGKLKMSDEDFRAFCDKRIAESEANSGPHRRAISTACRERAIVLASHDDATVEHVEEAIDQGIHVAEFPTTFEAAKASREAGMAVLMVRPMWCGAVPIPAMLPPGTSPNMACSTFCRPITSRSA